jgi:SAM-dependent methyltransferase
VRRLVLGPGAHTEKTAADTFVDLRPLPAVDVAWDLNRTPWPFGNEEFAQVEAHHLIEHLHSLITFMDECWRVLEPGGSVYLTTPLAGADGCPDLQWCDPTHVRPGFRPHSFINYFTPEGIERFHYTSLPWAFRRLEVDEWKVLHVAGRPIKGAR